VLRVACCVKNSSLLAIICKPAGVSGVLGPPGPPILGEMLACPLLRPEKPSLRVPASAHPRFRASSHPTPGRVLGPPGPPILGKCSRARFFALKSPHLEYPASAHPRLLVSAPLRLLASSAHSLDNLTFFWQTNFVEFRSPAPLVEHKHSF
jgi:hypothetical protein